MRKEIDTNSSKKKRSVVAFSSLMLLVSGSLLYPDTMTNVSYYIGAIRFSPLLILFLISAPVITFYVYKERYRFPARLLDAFFVSTIVYIVARGLIASTGDTNLTGLVLAYGGYSVVIYFGAAVIYQSREYVPWTISILAILAAIVSLLAIPDFLLNWNFPYEALIRDKITFKSVEYRRIGSTIAAPGQMSAFLVMIIPFVVYVFIHARSSSKKAIFGLLILTVIVALWMSFVKISWLVFIIMVIGGLVFLIIKRPEGLAKQMVIVGLSAIFVVSIFSFLFWDRVELLLFSEQRQSESIDMRLRSWESSPETFTNNPFFGTGIWRGNTESASQAIDNLYLTIIVEQGIIGFSLVIATFILMIRNVLKLLHEDDVSRTWTILILISLGSLLLTGLTSSPIFVWPTMVVFYLFLGILRALIEINNRNEFLCVQK